MKKIITVITVLALVLTLSGCKEVPSFMPSYWDGLTKAGAREYIQDTLKEKYGEEFVVTSMGVRSGQYYRELVGTCSPKSDEKIAFNFEVTHFGEDRYMRDGYIRNVVRKQVKENIDNVLSKNYETFAAEVGVLELHRFYDSGIYSAKEATIKAFSESFAKNGEEDDNETSVWIVIDKSETDNIDKLNNAIKEMTSEFYSLKVYIEVFFGDQETIDVCNKEINAYTSYHYGVMNITEKRSDFRLDWFIYDEEGLLYRPNINNK